MFSQYLSVHPLGFFSVQALDKKWKFLVMYSKPVSGKASPPKLYFSGRTLLTSPDMTTLDMWVFFAKLLSAC